MVSEARERPAQTQKPTEPGYACGFLKAFLQLWISSPPWILQGSADTQGGDEGMHCSSDKHQRAA